MGKLLRTIIITGAAFVLNLLINLVLTPFITDTVGTEAYGFVSLAKNCAQYATIITVALNSFASRYIALEFHNGNLAQSNVYFSSVFWGDFAIGSIIVAAAFGFIGFLEYIFVVPEAILTDVKILFIFVFINFWITTVFTVFSSSAYIKNKLDISGIFKGLSYVAEAIVLLALYAFLPEKIFYVGIGLVAAALVIALSNIYISQKYTPDLSINRKWFKKSAVRRLILDGLWSSANSLGDVLNSGLDLAVCNLLLTPTAMGQVAIAKTIDNIFHSLYQMVSQAFQPLFLKSYAVNNKNQLLSELKLSMKMSGMLSNIAFAGFFALGMSYYQLWIPNQDIGLIYGLTLVTISASIVTGPMTPLYYIYTLTVKKKIPCMVTILGGFFNVAGMFILIRYTSMGIYAVVWTTTIVMVTINFVTNPLYMSHVLKIPWKTFYPSLFRNIFSCIILTCVFSVFGKIYMPHSWMGLIVCALLYSVAGAFLHFAVVYDNEEKKKLYNALKNRFMKKK